MSGTTNQNDELLILDEKLSAPAHLNLDEDIEDPLSPCSSASSPLGVLTLISPADPHHPIHWPAWKKWLVVTAYCFLQVIILMLSTSYVSATAPLKEKFGGSTQVVALGQSMFIVGNAVGPLFLGPLSDIGGRKWVYAGSTAIFGLCQIVRFALFFASSCMFDYH
jgi:hypothetical protein